MKNRTTVELVQDVLYRKADLAKRFQCSGRQIELMVADGRLPKPFYLGDASPRWRKSDIDAWLERKAIEANQGDLTETSELDAAGWKEVLVDVAHSSIDDICYQAEHLSPPSGVPDEFWHLKDTLETTVNALRNLLNQSGLVATAGQEGGGQ